MNNITLVGRLASDIQTKAVGENTVATFSLAVKRDFAKEGQQDADFITIEVWGKTADNCVKYLEKGRQVAIVGSLRIEKYVKDGENKSFTKVRANNVEFLSSGKKESGEASVPQETAPNESYKDYVKQSNDLISNAKLDDEDIPF